MGGRREAMPGTCNPRRLRQKDLHECDKINKLGVGSQWSQLERMGVLALDRDWGGPFRRTKVHLRAAAKIKNLKPRLTENPQEDSAAG